MEAPLPPPLDEYDSSPLLPHIDPNDDVLRIPALPACPDHEFCPVPMDSPSTAPAPPTFLPSDFVPDNSCSLPDTDDDSDLDGLPYAQPSDDDEDPSDDDDDDSAETLNYFVHNGYRYDGDVFELRPPQERSIASRPERILEHKPPLLSNRQVFNRVYSEGTYNARPSSLRQPRRSSSRFSASSFATTVGADEPPSAACIDTPENQLPALPVTRPPSLRPSAAAPLSPNGLYRTIEEVRRAATDGHCNQNLYGLLAYSSTPVTRIEGEKPELLAAKNINISSLPRQNSLRKRQDSFKKKGTAAVLKYEGSGDPHDENHHPHTVREKRGRSYTSFAKSTPYSNVSNPHGSGRTRRSGDAPMQKRTPFWKSKLLSR